VQLASFNLSATQHGGVAVTLTSSAPGVLLLQPDSGAVGKESITINVANGASSGNFYVTGVVGASGSATVTVSAPGFVAGAGSSNVTLVAGWFDLTPQVTVTLSAPLYDVAHNVYGSSVTVGNPLNRSITGRLRAVITSSSKTPLVPDGIAADGKPYYNLVTDPTAVLSAGKSASPRDITFTASRGALTYTARIEYNPY
jgi:hypothetical protein